MNEGENIMLLNEQLLQESWLHVKKFDDNTNMNELSQELNEIKDKIDDSKEDVEEFYTKNKRDIFSFCGNLLKNWVLKGAILGVAVVPFTISMMIVKKLLKKIIKIAVIKGDEHMVKENIQLYISYLTQIKAKNPKLEKRINSTIDYLDRLVDKYVE